MVAPPSGTGVVLQFPPMSSTRWRHPITNFCFKFVWPRWHRVKFKFSSAGIVCVNVHLFIHMMMVMWSKKCRVGRCRCYFLMMSSVQ